MKRTRTTIHPHEDRYVIDRIPEPEKTAGGIIIPVAATDKPARGRIVATGPGKWVDDHGYRKPAFDVGDVVLFGRFSGTEIEFNLQKVTILREDEIVARVEEVEYDDGIEPASPEEPGEPGEPGVLGVLEDLVPVSENVEGRTVEGEASETIGGAVSGS